MSDAQQGNAGPGPSPGEGWWLASDGRWYPPVSAPPAPPSPPLSGPPAATAPPPPPAPPAPPGYVPVQAFVPAASYTPPAQTSSRAIAVLALGIAGLVFTCFYGIGIVPAIIALSLAPGAKREIRGSDGRVQGEGFVTGGVVCGWVSVGLTAVGAILAIVFLVVIGISATSTTVP